MRDLLILNDVSPDNAIGGQATFIKNLLPFLKKHYNPNVLILPKSLLGISFIPRRLLYLLFLVFKTKSIRKSTLIFSHTPEASYYVSLINPKSLFHVFHGNNNPVTTSKYWYGKHFKFVFNHFEKMILKKAKACMTVGQVRENTIKINQPIDRKIIDGIPDSLARKNLLFVGRLEEVKQIDKIIKLYYKYINEHKHCSDNLVLCGEGIKENELRKLVSELNLNDRVIFTGKAPYDEVITMMKSSKLLLMASLYEGFPMVIAEALCCGLPVISTDVGSVSDVIINNYNGYLLQSGYSDNEYCDCIGKVLENPADFTANSLKSASVFDAEYLVSHTFKPIFDHK